MAYILQTRKTDTLATTMAAGANSCTLTSGSFGSPTGTQILTIDYDVAAKAADFSCTISGTAVTSMTLLNGPDVEHSGTAKVAMCLVDEHYGTNGTPDTAWTAHTPTFTGFTATIPSGYSSRYFQLGKIVIWKYRSSTPGASNATTFTMTLPVTASANARMTAPVIVYDNGAWQTAIGVAVIENGGTTVEFGKSAASPGGFTGSGNKDCSFTLIYEAA